MYSRDLQEVPASLIQGSKPVLGTFNGPVKSLDIRGLRAPFGGVPLPSFVTNFRIKSTLSFSFNTGDYFCSIIFYDGKAFGLAEIDLWNNSTGRKYVYKSLMGPRRRFIPHNLEQGFCASFNSRRYIRISWDHTRDRFSVIFNIKGDSVRPSIQAALTGHLNDSRTAEITQCIPIISKRRCAASYFATPVMKGTLSITPSKKGETISENVENASSIFFINRAYHSYIQKSQLIYGTGMVDGKHVSFIIENSPEQIPDPEVCNRNLLIVDGQCTPLPPVKMTQPFGLDEKWIIQDYDNMVDLTWQPVAMHTRNFNLFVNKIRMDILFGKFEGVLKTKDGADINIDGLAGVGREQMMRV